MNCSIVVYLTPLYFNDFILNSTSQAQNTEVQLDLYHSSGIICGRQFQTLFIVGTVFAQCQEILLIVKLTDFSLLSGVEAVLLYSLVI